MKRVLRFLLPMLAIVAWLLAPGGALAQGSTGFDHTTTGFLIDTPHRSVACDSCHISGILRGTPRDCQTCHAGPGARASGKPATHIPTGLPCNNCHRPDTPTWSAPPTGFTLGGTGHPISPLIGVTQTNCQTCHNGGFVGANADAKPASHILTAASCGTCHGTTSWLPARNPHVGVTPGTCASCHGTTAPGKRPGHIPTTASCDTCHTNFVSFSPAQMNHAGMTGQCSTCHSGSYVSQNAQIKPATHIATTAQCDTCHMSTITWATVSFNHSLASPPAAGRCSSCHNGTAALGKPSTHIPTTSQCDSCHTNFTAFKPAQMNHTGLAGQCSTCHNGNYVYANALGKVANHIPVSSQCDTCHTNFVSFFPAQMNHAGMAGQCSTCHSGSYVSQNAQTKPATHISTTAQCDNCHNSTTTWATAVFDHTLASPPAAGRCSTCHNGTTALGKPTTHIPTTSQCDSCHNSYVAFKPAQMNHTGLAGQCSTCHNGAYAFVNALGKPATHIPVNGQCDTCHTRGFTSWSPSTMNHTGLTQCDTCHSGAYLSQNAQMKPATHQPTTAQCSSCHTSTTTWATATQDHSILQPPAAGRCSTCHNNLNALGKPTNHIPIVGTMNPQCDTCHLNYVAFAPATMSHGGTAGQCASCHGGAYTTLNAQAKPATHISTSQSCDICHTTSAWKPTSFAHQGVQAGTCTTCHDGVKATGKPLVHIPTTQSCDVCHRTGIAWLPMITPYGHAGIAAGTCSNCHGPANYPSMDVKPATHLPTTASCDACHTTTTWTGPYSYNHAGVTTCLSCHVPAYTGIVSKPGNHIPTMLAGMKGDECGNCHSKTVFTSFTTGERMNHGTLQSGCANCHDSATPYNAGIAMKITRGPSHHNSGGKDCSSTGCHRPLGLYGTPYTKWN